MLTFSATQPRGGDSFWTRGGVADAAGPLNLRLSLALSLRRGEQREGESGERSDTRSASLGLSDEDRVADADAFGRAGGALAASFKDAGPEEGGAFAELAASAEQVAVSEGWSTGVAGKASAGTGAASTATAA